MSRQLGEIVWTDLSVNDAERIRDFYAAVCGWKVEPVDMGGYPDFNMQTEQGKAVAGICHARGVNAGLPVQWLVYVSVPDIDKSVEQSVALGGKVVADRRPGMCVIEDPAGAVLALVSRDQP